VNTATAVIIGSVLGLGYFAEGERGIPKESNCTYLSPANTDIAAWLAGAYLIVEGHKRSAPGVAVVGAMIASLHAAQFGAHKRVNRPPALPAPNYADLW